MTFLAMWMTMTIITVEIFISQLSYFIIVFVPLLLVMAFITLLERKIMGVMQRRRGPNVVGFFGVLQPFADGIKLLCKEPVFPYQSDIAVFGLAPLLTFAVSIIAWVVVPFTTQAGLDVRVGILVILSSSSLGVYGILLAGWSSNSKYAFFGAIRSAAQMISYEVAMGLAIFPVMCLAQTFAFSGVTHAQAGCWFGLTLFPAALAFYISILAETNRSPFDLPEAEGELVAGYNVEYSAFFFAFFYLAEYLNILLLSGVFVIFFLGGFTNFFGFAIKIVMVVYTVVWVRATLPRYRYDQLMVIGWKILLPFTTGYAVFVANCLWGGAKVLLIV